MKNILLTSAGLSENFKKLFFSKVKKKPENIKIMFVPCASVVSDGAREGLPIGIVELINMGIQKNNIFIYDLKYILSEGYSRTYSSTINTEQIPLEFRLPTAKELEEFDAVLFTGGEAFVLLDEINRTGFNSLLIQAVNNGLFYIGVSAGSMIAAGNFRHSLGFIKNSIIPHCETGFSCGDTPDNIEIPLTDKQAIWIDDIRIQIIE